MASDNEASCASDPNFAVICSFLGCFGKPCGVIYPDIARLQEMLENTQEVSRELIDLHIKLLRKTRKSVSPEKWERALVKFCHTYSNQDGWELERFGYKKARIAVKLRLLKVLLETQFDLNQKFKNEVNKLAADELRVEPLGRDKGGLAYWCQLDEESNIRVYREDLDEENWELVAKDREGVVNLISTLSNGEIGAIPINEDSNSLEISEKPIIDTGQVTTSPSLEDEVVQENGVHVDEMNDKQLPNGRSDEFEDEQEHDQAQDQDRNDITNKAEKEEEEEEEDEEEVEEEEEDDDEDEDEADEEEDIDAEEEDVSNDESSKQVTEEDDSQEMVQTLSIESRCTNDSSSLSAINVKTLNMKMDAVSEDTSHRKATDEISTALISESKSLITHKQTGVTKAEVEESIPLKSIETPVITSSPLKLVNIAELKQSPEEKLTSPTTPVITSSPLKLVNIAELKQSPEEKLTSPTIPVIAPLNAAKKHGAPDEMADPVMMSLEKLPGKNNLPFSSTDFISVGHSKLSVKPIDQLAANLVRIQSEKLEKPSGPKSLEKIAESLARSSGMLGNMVNGEDDRLPHDFCARNQSEKSSTHRGHRGIDLSTSPRGWENANEQNRPVDFSGIDLSSRKLGKTVDLPSPGYRTQDFQHREMDLSTKKVNKPEVSNLPYDARSVMLRNHVMVADLSKRQMPFTPYEMSSAPYHNTARLPAKDEHRLPSYAILSDPSKITALRMNATPLKRPLEDDDVQQDMLKRIRADVIPIRSSMDKRPMMSGNWRDEVSEAIEEPMMMVQGEGSGSDCDAVNPIVGDAIEEPTVFFYGEGSGAECETGNPGDDAPTDNKESNESKTEPDSATTAISQNKVLTEGEVSTGSIVSNKTPVKLNRNYPQSNVSVNDNYQIIDSIQEKPKFKHTLGVQIIPKSTTGPVKRLSRWDVGKPEEKGECDSSIISNEGDISPKGGTDGRDTAERKLPGADVGAPKTGYENSADVDRGVETDGLVNAGGATVGESAKLQVSDVSSEDTSTMKRERDSKLRGPVQCDSSVSSCRADPSREPEPRTDPEPEVDSADARSVTDSSGAAPREPDTPGITNNECKPAAASPPRFFFGPNCISYTSKSDESQSERGLAASVRDEADTVQYECVSSSKPADDAAYPYKAEDFDLTQTNNNSLKSDLFTSESDDVLCGSNSKDVGKAEAPSDTWDQAKEVTPTANSSIEPNGMSECNVADSPIAQVQTEPGKESSVRESVCADKGVGENDCSKLRASKSEVVTENESINDASMTEEESVEVGSISEPGVQPAEPGTVGAPRCDQFTDPGNPVSTESLGDSFKRSDEIASQRLDDKEEDRNEKSPADDTKNEDNYQPGSTNAFKEEQDRIESEATAHSSLSPLTQNSQAELADLREFEDVNSNEPLDSTNASESANYREANRLEKTDLDSAGESYDKQSDRNDNFSEIDGQEDHLTDTDNEKTKGLAGSDADSLCVNYDKNSERTDALSDVGTQDDGSGDSEGVKEKELNDAQVNDAVFGMDPETHLPENSLATSSEPVREGDKHDIVPTVSSSDDASAQDSSSQGSEPVRMDGEKVESASSDTDKPSTFNISPATVPETNVFELSKSDVVETAKETSLSDLVQSASECTNDASENPSSCIDQDPDVGISESNELFKETEETEETTNTENATSVERPGDAGDAVPEVPTEFEKGSPIVTSIERESCRSAAETEISEKEEPAVDAESKANNDLGEFTAKDESETCDADERDTTVAEDASCEVNESEEIAENAEGSEADAATVIAEQSEADAADAISQVSQVRTANDNKQSLVANYDSDSNDNGSDDVYEPGVTRISDSRDRAAASTERKPSDELHEKSSVKEDDVVGRADLVSDVPEGQAPAEQQLGEESEEPSETKADEVSNQDASIEQDVEISEQKCVDETQVKSVYNNIECHSNDQSTTPSDEAEFREEANVRDLSVPDDSKALGMPDTAKLSVAPVATGEVTESVRSKTFSERETIVDRSEKSREHIGNSIDDVKTEEETEGVAETTAKADCLTSENVCNSNRSDANEAAKVPFAQENAEFNAADDRVTGVFRATEQRARNVDEKPNVSPDAENSARSKNVNELITEELPVPCKRFKEDLDDCGDRDNKWDVKLEGECPAKPFAEGLNLPAIKTELDIAPTKLDNDALDADKSQATWRTEDANLVGSASPDALYYPNSIPTKTEGVNNLDSCNNQNEPFSINMNVNRITECFGGRSAPPGADDDSTTFPGREVVPKVDAVRSDPKKEASKRLIDASDVEDVPPLKSKPPCSETDEETPENLTGVDVRTPEALDVANEVEKLGPPIGDEARAPSISTTQLFQNDFDTVKDRAAAAPPTEDPAPDDAGAAARKGSPVIPDIEMKYVPAASDDSTGADNESVFNVPSEETDPLACTDDDALRNIAEDASDAPEISIRVQPAADLVYEGWKLDGGAADTPPKVSRKRRSSAHESNSEDGTAKQGDEEVTGGKRMKLRGKRIPDKELRKSIEESRGAAVSSEDEAVKCDRDHVAGRAAKDGDPSVMQAMAIDKKIRGRPKGRRRRGYRGRPSRPKLAEFQGEQTSEVSPGAHPDGTSNDALNTAQKKRKKRKMVLGLEIGRDISLESEAPTAGQDETPVRQSRRIAQLKIKEQADRRRIEEETMRDLDDNKKESEKKKRKKQKSESEEEVIIKEIEKEKKSKKKRRKRKKKKMLAKFNEANPWQSSSGSSSDEENENEDEEEEDEDMESEGSLLFKSDHEFSPESDLEKDQESEPLRRARTAQKAQSDVEEAEDEYACQKCGKADHPEWILLCDSCDKGWHCSCLRPALMLIPEGDWFCPPCQHTLLVTKLRDTLKTLDLLTKRHENEVLRKKRLAFVGISLDNVLHKGEAPRGSKGSKASSQESDNESSESSSSASSSETSSSEESEPVYQLRERRCASTYKFNEYDDMINAAIQDEVEAVQGAGNQGRGKDIATIVNAEKEEAQAEALKMTQLEEDKDDVESKPEKESDEEYKIENEDAIDEMEEEPNTVARKLLARKKHRKLNSLDISSEDDPDSDEDFKGTSSDDEEDFDDHITSSDDSFANVKRRGRKGEPRPVRRSTRARMTRAYDEDFINDDSDESDRPKRKKSRSMWGDSADSEDSDNSWRQRKKKSRTIPTSRFRTVPKTKGKKKKKRKRIIESDNQSENDEEDEPKIEEQCESNLQDLNTTLNEMLDVKQENLETTTPGESNTEIKDERLQEAAASDVSIPQAQQPSEVVPIQKVKKDIVPKPKKAPGIRRKIIYGGLPDENRQEEEEILGRRTRGRKINYREAIASDSEEELKKALMKKVGESEDEFMVNEVDDMNDDGEKDSDSGDVYIPKKDALKFKNKSPKAKKPRNSKSPAAKRKSLSDDLPKQRKKPGPKPGSKNRGRKQKLKDDMDGDMISAVMDNPIGDIASKMDDNLSDNVGLTGTTMSVASSFTGDVPEGSLTGLGAGELADLDDEQFEQMMGEDYGRRQLELAAIEIAKKKKKEEREAKKLEKARLKALEILAAERQRDPNAPEGTDGEAPKKKKRGRRSKAEIIAEQMRRDGAPNLGIAPAAAIGGIGTPDGMGNMSHNVNPATLPTGLTPETDRSVEGGHMPLMTGPDGQLFTPDGTPMKPKRRGRGKGKKTLALEAARAAEAAAKVAAEVGLIAGMGADSNSEMKQNDIPNVLPTPGSSTSGSAPSTPPASAVPTPGPPSAQPSNSQPVYPSLPPGQQSSVITRMLQSQPVSSSPQSFTAAAAAMGHKYFGGPNAGGPMMGGPRTGYEMQPRARIPSPYRQTGQSSMPPHFAAVRSGTPPMRMRVPGPQMYHTPHHPMDPSPSGGGPISISNRDRSSPLTPGGPAMIPPSAGSPLAKGGPTPPPPPPPPYVRGGPPMVARFAENPMGPRHQLPPFTNASPVNHNMQQPSPPPNRPPGNFSPYHPPPPPNYHYGAYPPPPPMSTADDAAAYQSSPYPSEHFSTPADNQPPIQGPPPPQAPQQSHPNDEDHGTGEFGGLVSYFSSQREDDLDS